MSSRRSRGQSQRRSSVPSYTPRSTNSVKKEVRTQMLQVAERKYLDTNYDTGTIGNTGVVSQLSAVPQGSTAVTRIGDSLFAKSLVLRGNFWSLADISVFRFIIIRWLANSTPTASEVLENDGTDKCVISHYNHHAKKKFKVLYDSGCQQAVSTYGSPSGAVPINTLYAVNVLPKTVIPLNFKLEFDAGSSTNSDNRLYLMYWSQSSNDVGFKLNVRFNFLDM